VTSQTLGVAAGNSRRRRYETVAVRDGLVGHVRLPVGTAQDEPARRKQRRPSTTRGAGNTTGRLPQCAQAQGYQLIACLTTVVMATAFLATSRVSSFVL